MLQLQLNGNPYQIADSVYVSVLLELQRDDILDTAAAERMRHYYRHLLDPKRSVFFRHHASQGLAYILEQVASMGPETAILDIACGMGTQSILYGLLGYTVTGLDISSQDISIAERRTRFYSNQLEHQLKATFVAGNAIDYVQGSNGPFDVVVVLEAISHIHPAEAFLDSVGSLLSPGGLLIISDTNGLNPAIRWKLFREVGTFGYVVREAQDPVTGEVQRHVYKRVFSVPSLGRMLRARGYRIVGSRGSGFVPALLARQSGLFGIARATERLLYSLPGHHMLGTSYTLVAKKER